jgi:hypothetical protein
MRRPIARRIPRRRGALTGLLLVLLGAWVALIPFVGPYFDYQVGTTSAWDWSADRLWLSVLPGAATALGGLILLFSKRRVSASLGSLLALAGGLWLVSGPVISLFWNHGQIATGPAIGDTGTRVVEWLGFYFGVGALITLLSAYVLGFLAALPVTGEAVQPGTGVAEREPQREPAPIDGREEPAPAASQDDAAPPRRRRGLLRRREPARR